MEFRPGGWQSQAIAPHSERRKTGRTSEVTSPPSTDHRAPETHPFVASWNTVLAAHQTHHCIHASKIASITSSFILALNPQ